RPGAAAPACQRCSRSGSREIHEAISRAQLPTGCPGVDAKSSARSPAPSSQPRRWRMPSRRPPPGAQRPLVALVLRGPWDSLLSMRQQHDEAALVKRWRLGHAAAAERQRRLLAEEGARPAQAVAESLSALNALEALGLWPGPRDEISELGVEQV